jgi:hypothetical protein
MLCAIGASFVFQILTRTSVGSNWVVLGMVEGVLDPQMDSVLDPKSPDPGLESCSQPDYLQSTAVLSSNSLVSIRFQCFQKFGESALHSGAKLNATVQAINPASRLLFRPTRNTSPALHAVSRYARAASESQRWTRSSNVFGAIRRNRIREFS